MNAEAPTTVRPVWVDELVAEHGEPTVDCTEPIGSVDRTRQCWAWVIGGGNHFAIVDRTNLASRRYVAAAGSPGRRADLVGPDRPTDDEMRALVVLGWGGSSA